MMLPKAEISSHAFPDPQAGLGPESICGRRYRLCRWVAVRALGTRLSHCSGRLEGCVRLADMHDILQGSEPLFSRVTRDLD
jgi:hypothetical protein